MKTYDIFISYSRKDKDLVFPLKDEIEQRISTKCWIDLKGIESDQQFSEVILEAINNTEIFIFMYSQNSAESEWTKKELNFADVKKKKIVFVNLTGSDLDDWFLLNFGLKDRIDIKDKDQKEKLFRNLKDWCNPKETTIDKTISAGASKYNLKIKPNQDCQVLIDEEERGMALANKITKFPLVPGEYCLACVSKESNTRIDLEDFEIEDKDILRKVEFPAKTVNPVKKSTVSSPNTPFTKEQQNHIPSAQNTPENQYQRNKNLFSRENSTKKVDEKLWEIIVGCCRLRSELSFSTNLAKCGFDAESLVSRIERVYGKTYSKGYFYYDNNLGDIYYKLAKELKINTGQISNVDFWSFITNNCRYRSGINEKTTISQANLDLYALVRNLNSTFGPKFAYYDLTSCNTLGDILWKLQQM